MSDDSRRTSGGEGVAVALWAYLAPLTTSRSLRIGFFLLLGFSVLVALALVLRPVADAIASHSLERLRRGVILPGVPLAALLLSEIPIRDGIRHRTLLYPLLGPVSRPVLAGVRTVATAVLAAVGLSILLIVVRIVEGGDSAPLGGELAAVALGSGAYVGIFGLVHLLTRRGLIAGLALYGLIDDPLARLPFSLRNLSPSFHLRVLADQPVEMQLPVDFTPPPTSEAVSALTLAGIGVVLILLTTFLFSRKQLGEVC